MHANIRRHAVFLASSAELTVDRQPQNYKPSITPSPLPSPLLPCQLSVTPSTAGRRKSKLLKPGFNFRPSRLGNDAQVLVGRLLSDVTSAPYDVILITTRA